MTDMWRAIIILFAAVNPAAAAMAVAAWSHATPLSVRLATAGASLAVASVAFLGAVFGADGILDLLDVEPETFRIAAGIVMLPGGLQAAWQARWTYDDEPRGWQAALFPLALPLLVSPAAMVAAMSISVDDGRGVALGAAAAAVSAGAAAFALGLARWPGGTGAAARLLGAVMVVAAAAFAVDGVRDV